MKQRDIWTGWDFGGGDMLFVPGEGQDRRSRGAHAVALPRANAASCRTRLPELTQYTTVELSVPDPEVLAVLGQLPSLDTLHLIPNGNEVDGAQLRAFLAGLALLPALRSLHLRAPLLPEIGGAKGLVRLSVHTLELPAEGLASLASLPLLEELRVRGPHGTLPSAPFAALATSNTLRDVHLENGSLDAAALGALIRAPNLEVASLSGPPSGGAVEIEKASRLRSLWLPMYPDRARFSALPALRTLYTAAAEVEIDGLPSLRELSVSADGLRIARTPRLRSIFVFGGPSRLSIEGAPALQRVDARVSRLPPAGRAALEAAHPRCDFIFEAPKHKRVERTAEKRKLRTAEWKHPRIGVEDVSYAVLVAGRALGSLTVSRAAELATIAEVVSQERGEHLVAVLSEDLSSSKAIASTDDAGPIVVGRVVAFVSANDGPSAALATSDMRLAIESALPDAFWNEACGVVGNDALAKAPTRLYLLAAGPSADATLALGTVVLAPGSGLLSGQDEHQRPHSHGVAGTLIEASGLHEATRIDLDALSIEGDYHLICRYD